MAPTSKHHGECPRIVFRYEIRWKTRTVKMIWSFWGASYSINPLQRSFKSMMMFILKYNAEKHCKATFAADIPRTTFLSKSFSLWTCPFAAVAPSGLNLSIWLPRQKHIIFLILLFMKLHNSCFGGSGLRFFDFGTLLNYRSGDVRRRQILISYCFCDSDSWLFTVYHTSVKVYFAYYFFNIWLDLEPLPSQRHLNSKLLTFWVHSISKS
jgi:hypothetical protein